MGKRERGREKKDERMCKRQKGGGERKTGREKMFSDRTAVVGMARKGRQRQGRKENSAVIPQSEAFSDITTYSSSH